MENNNNTHSSSEEEIIYLVLTDVINSCSKTEEDKWRANSFRNQLSHLLKDNNSFALKSVGDALFVTYSINKLHDEASVAMAVLANVWGAFSFCAISNSPIRCAVHQIRGHHRGSDIIKGLKNLKGITGNINYLKKTLANDIFGNEVNKAWRILSLAREPAVIVSEDIAETIAKVKNKSSEILALEGDNIEFDHGEQSFELHSPVPVLYMKGIKLQGKNSEDNYCLVWHLGSPDSTPSLAHEFKQLQAFRQIVVDAGEPIEFPKQRAEFTKAAFHELIKLPPTEMGLSDETKSDFNIKRRFYFDMVWSVIERFDVCGISFTRRVIDVTSDSDFRKRLSSLLEQPYNSSASGDTDNISCPIKGEDGNIIIESSKKAINSALYTIYHKNKQTRSFTSLLVFTSCPDQKHSDIIRDMLLSDKPKKDVYMPYMPCMTCMPQTIDIYKAASINDFYVSANRTSSENTVPIYSNGKYLMVMFQVCSKDIHNAKKESALFSNCVAIKGTEVMMYGLTSGLIDGFVIYKIKDNEEGWVNVVKQLFIAYMVQGEDGIFGKTYPVSIYILEALPDYPPLKKNLRYLIDIHKANSKEREDEC